MGAPASHWEPLDDDDEEEKEFTKPSKRTGPSKVPVPGMDPTDIDDQDLQWLNGSSSVAGLKESHSRRAVGSIDSDVVAHSSRAVGLKDSDIIDKDDVGWLNGTDGGKRRVESQSKDPVNALKGKGTKKVKHNSPLRTQASKIVQAKIREMTTTESAKMPEEVEMTSLSKSSVLRPPTLAAKDLGSNRDTQILDSDDENWLNGPARRPPFASSSQGPPSPAARDLELNQGMQLLDNDDEQWLNDVGHDEREPDGLKKDVFQNVLGSSLLLTTLFLLELRVWVWVVRRGGRGEVCLCSADRVSSFRVQ